MARDCIGLVTEAMNGASRSTVESFADDLDGIRKGYEASTGVKMTEPEFRQIAMEYIGSYRADAVRAKLATAQNIMKYNKVKSDVKAHATPEAQGRRLLEMWEGSLRRATGASDSVWARFISDTAHHEGDLISRLKERSPEYPDGLYELAVKGDKQFQRDVHIELSELNKHDGSAGKTGSKEALELAKILKRSYDSAQGIYEKGGAFVRKLYGYAGPRRWDPVKLMDAGEDAFVAELLPHADKKRMIFSLSGGQTIEARIREMYRHIVSGESERLNDFAETDNTLIRMVDMPANLAKRAERSRTFHFSTAEAEFDVVSKYGYEENLVEKAFHSVRSASRASAMMDMFGANPQANIARLRKELRLTGPEFKKIDDAISLYTMADHDPRVTVTSNVGDTIRGWIYAAKMGMATINSLPDLASRARELMTTTTRGFLEGHAKSVASFLESVPESMRRETARKIGLHIDGILEEHNRYGHAADRPGTFANLTRWTNSANGLSFWMKANKVGHSRVIASDLADMSGRSFAELDDVERMTLSRSNIGQAQWELIRHSNVADNLKPSSDKSLIGLNDIDLVPDDVALKIMKDGGIKVGDSEQARARAIRRFRADTKTVLGGYFMTRVNNAMLEPGLRERRIISGIIGHGRKNTVSGQFQRFVAMFKTYPVSFISNHLNDIAMAKGASTWQEGIRSMKFDHGAMASTAVTMTLLGYLSLVMKDAAEGKEPRKPDVMESFVKGGAGGLMGDFLFGEFDRRYGRSYESFFLGPVVGQMSDVMDVWQNLKAAALEDDPKALDKAKNQASRIFINNAPFANMFWLRGALNHTMLYDIQERMNPGYLQRMEQRMREKGQEFYTDPRAHWVLPR